MKELLQRWLSLILPGRARDPSYLRHLHWLWVSCKLSQNRHSWLCSPGSPAWCSLKSFSDGSSPLGKGSSSRSGLENKPSGIPAPASPHPEMSRECGPICFRGNMILWSTQASESSNIVFYVQPLQLRLQSGLGLSGHTWCSSSPSNPPYSTTFHSFQGLYECAQVKYRQMGMGRSLRVMPYTSANPLAGFPSKNLEKSRVYPNSQ